MIENRHKKVVFILNLKVKILLMSFYMLNLQ